MRDIVLIMTDQHNGNITSLFDENTARTPFLQQLKATSAVFRNAYCNCPLCVPSRSSFLTGKYPSELNIFDNDTTLNSSQVTIAHALGLQGYRTVLVGRMHFKGYDQYHGFDERYVGDITTQFWGTKREDLHYFQGTMQAEGCLKQYGYGISPVLYYDETVIKKAVELLKEDREEPIFMIVGLYAPHFPYVCPKEFYKNYINKAYDMADIDYELLNIYQSMRQKTTPEEVRQIRAAYYGMVEKIDSQIAEVYQAYEKRQALKTEQGVFIYTSDHGDQLGKRGLFGKKTLYEDSIRIPLIIEDGLQENKVFEQEVSLLDLTKTILDYGNASMMDCQGTNVFAERTGPVKIESIVEHDNIPYYIQTVIKDGIKLMDTGENQQLIYLQLDTREESSCDKQFPNELSFLKKHLNNKDKQNQIITKYKAVKQNNVILKEWGRTRQLPEPNRSIIPEYTTVKPCKTI